MRISLAVALFALLALSSHSLVSAKSKPVELDTNQTRVCFDTVLTATASQVVANQGHLTCPPLWKLNTRHVFASQLSSDRTRLMMISTYPYASGTATHSATSVNVFETYLVSTGALVSSIELKDAILPSLANMDDPAVSFCTTAQDVFFSTQGAGNTSHLQHYDIKTGLKKAMVAYEPITRSDRLWLACNDAALYVSVPAANAVWQLSPADGLLERIVTRLPSPAALSLDSSFLRVVMGRPALRVLTFDLVSGTHRSNVGVASSQLNLRGISFAPSQAATLIVTLDDSQTVRVLTDPLSNVVSTDRQLAVNRAQMLLADGKTVIVNGLPVSLTTGNTLTSVADSALLNDGNAEQLSAVAYTTPDRKLIIVDTRGGVARFSSFEHDCSVFFDAALPALLTEDARVLHTDTDSHNIMSLLYLASDGSTVVLREDIGDRQEHVWPAFCPDANEQIIAGLATAWPEPRVCVLCSAEVICLDMKTQQRFAFYLPVHMLNNLEQVRLEWSEDHTLLVLFYAGTEVWLLDGSIVSEGFVMVRRFEDLPAVLDVHYWDVVNVHEDLYTLRISSTQLMVVSGENWTSIAEPVLDHKQTLGADVLLVPNLGAPTYLADSLCVGFRGNQTVGPRDMLTQDQASTMIGILAASAVLFIVSCLGGLGCCCFGVFRRSAYSMPCCPAKLKEGTGYGSLGDGNHMKKRSAGWLRDLACGISSQNICFGFLCCCPSLASRVNAIQQSVRYPACTDIRMTDSLARDAEGGDDGDDGDATGPATPLSTFNETSFDPEGAQASVLTPNTPPPSAAAAAASPPPIGQGLDGFLEEQ
jgi:hypothetical protein